MHWRAGLGPGLSVGQDWVLRLLQGQGGPKEAGLLVGGAVFLPSQLLGFRPADAGANRLVGGGSVPAPALRN